MNLEEIVRPFQGASIFPSAERLGPLTAPGIVFCSLGNKGGKTVSWSFSAEGKAPVSENTKLKETGRTSIKQRIENPDDSSQFVEVCQATSIKTTSEARTDKAPAQSTYTNFSAMGKMSKQEYDTFYTGGKDPNPECAPTGKPVRGCT